MSRNRKYADQAVQVPSGIESPLAPATISPAVGAAHLHAGWQYTSTRATAYDWESKANVMAAAGWDLITVCPEEEGPKRGYRSFWRRSKEAVLTVNVDSEKIMREG
jgi:hypothetical protein